MIEGERRFDISVRWPKKLRSSEADILDIPVDVGNNTVVQSSGPGAVPAALGTGLASPSVIGSTVNTGNPLSNTPRLRLRDLVSPVGDDGSPDPEGQFERHGASTIYREQGKRLIALKFSVRDRDLAGAVAEAQARTEQTLRGPVSGGLERRVRGDAGSRATADDHRAPVARHDFCLAVHRFPQCP